MTFPISWATAGGDGASAPESPGRPLEVWALFLQVLVVRVDGHKLWKAEGIHENENALLLK